MNFFKEAIEYVLFLRMFIAVLPMTVYPQRRETYSKVIDIGVGKLHLFRKTAQNWFK